MSDKLIQMVIAAGGKHGCKNGSDWVVIPIDSLTTLRAAVLADVGDVDRAEPSGFVRVPVEPTREMVEIGAGVIDDNGGNARWSDIREAWAEMLKAAPKEPTCPKQ